VSELSSERNPLFAQPRIMAGLCELGTHAKEDAGKAGVLLALLRGDTTTVDAGILPEFEEVRMILGLASPRMMTAEEEEELKLALEAFLREAAMFGMLIERHYYGRHA
jgi:hypothetical protein